MEAVSNISAFCTVLRRGAVLVTILFLGGCTPPSTDQVYYPSGDKVDIAYILLSPLCLIFCTTTVSTTGSQTLSGDGSNASTTQSTSQSTNASNSSSGGQ